jgi:hypothetical protein
MKNVIIILFIVFLFNNPIFAALPSDNFNDNTMGSLWTYYTEDVSKTWLQETNQRLELRAINSLIQNRAAYVSTWAFDTSTLFTMKINFHYNRIDAGTAGVILGIASDYNSTILIEAGYDGPSATSFFLYQTEVDDITIDFAWEPRTTSDGILYISYDPNIDAVYLSNTGYGMANAKHTVTGVVQNQWKAKRVLFWFGGHAASTTINSGDAYLDNFVVDSATIVCPQTLLGDLNSDCSVDLADFALMAGNWLIDCHVAPENAACK